ncbi:MAG: DUF6790 family protein [Solirubrobacterales bacterium]
MAGGAGRDLDLLVGDAYGHIHQMVVNDNNDPDNTGIFLYSDIVSPLVGLVLYGLFRRAGGGQPRRQGSGRQRSRVHEE